MRPLNRPMFRYGGPIKEGIMSGIRENYKKAGLVGDPVYPRTNGREHHSRIKTASKLPVVGGIINQTRGWIPRAWNKIRGWTGTTSPAPFTPVHQVQSKGGKLLNLKPRWKTGGTGPNVGDVGKVWTPHGWVSRDPLFKLGSAAWQGKGYLGKPLKWAGKTIATPTGGIGLVYLGGKWLTRDGKPANENEINEHLNTGGGKSGGVPGGGDQGMRGDGSWFAEQEKIAAAKAQKEKIQRYRDIMDIKGMNKEATANSLIEASRLINESGDFKGDIKSGSLINKIIGATSKQFDKPADTKRAIDTLILKGEIEKDINQSKGTAAFQAIDALAKASGKSHKYVANQKLGVPNTVGESVAQLKKIKKLPTSDDVATQVYSFSEQSGVPVQKHLTTEQKNEIIGKDKKYASLTELISKEEFTEDGYYIIGTSVIEVIDGVPRIKA